MRIAYRTTVSLAALALVSIGALGATAGPTDIYAPNGVAVSFRTPGAPVASRLLSGRYDGPTDMYAINGFRLSFGRSDRAAQPAEVCLGGSTDMYQPGAFAASFGSPAYSAVGQVAQACQGPAPITR